MLGQPNKPAVAGFILGPIAIFVGFGGACLGPLTFLAGIILGITGLILSILGLKRSRKTKTGRGLAIAGLIINLAWLVFVVGVMSITIYYRPPRLPAGMGA